MKRKVMTGLAIKKRYELVGLCFIATFICYLDRVIISVAVIALAVEFDWTESIKGLVLSSFFLGYVLMQIPAGLLAKHFGGKVVLGVSVLLWSLLTILTPIAAGVSLGLLLVTRFALGMGEAGTFPASFSLYKRWIPENERSRSVAILLSGAHLGTVAALLITGWVIMRFGWPIVFYAFGALGFLWAIFWFWRVVDSPGSHPKISEQELKELADCVDSEDQNNPFPWKRLLSEKAVWAVIINQFCSNWTIYMLLAWLPSYFHDALGISLTSASVYAIAPWITAFIFVNFAGWLADSLLKSGWSVVSVRKLMQSIGLLGPTVFLLFVPYAASALVATILFSGALGLGAFTLSGFAPNFLDITPQYAEVMAGFSNTIGSAPGFIGVGITGILIELTGTYTAAFYLAIAVNIFGAAIWILYAKGEKIID